MHDILKIARKMRRKPKKNEVVVQKTRNMLEYYDELGRNTYYENLKTGKIVTKDWLRFSDNSDKEIYVESSDGYHRTHYYDPFTGELLREVDSYGNRNLLAKRQEWNKFDTQLSREIREQRDPKPTKKPDAQNLF